MAGATFRLLNTEVVLRIETTSNDRCDDLPLPFIGSSPVRAPSYECLFAESSRRAKGGRSDRHLHVRARRLGRSTAARVLRRLSYRCSSTQRSDAPIFALQRPVGEPPVLDRRVEGSV